jgi:ankyrin repeat protein
VLSDLDLNAQDENGDTPLHVAYFEKALNVVRELERAGADQTVTNKHGLLPSESFSAEPVSLTSENQD